jgi:hypothetical protein
MRIVVLVTYHLSQIKRYYALKCGQLIVLSYKYSAQTSGPLWHFSQHILFETSIQASNFSYATDIIKVDVKLN